MHRTPLCPPTCSSQQGATQLITKMITISGSGGPGWLSRLSICLRLRSRSQGLGSSPSSGSLLWGESASPSHSAPPLTLALKLSLSKNEAKSLNKKTLGIALTPLVQASWEKCEDTASPGLMQADSSPRSALHPCGHWVGAGVKEGTLEAPRLMWMLEAT